MNEQQSALAYGRAYELFSQIFRHGLDDELVALMGLPLDRHDTHFGSAHYQLFVHDVFPYETIYLDDDGLLGGAVTERVAHFYQQIGFQPVTDESADHISTEFDALAYLCYAELDAVEDEIAYQIQRIRHLQRRFLDEHLLRWLPAFVIAVEQQDTTVYTAVVQQALQLVVSHRMGLGDDLMAPAAHFALPAAPDLLANHKTSLRDIARYLLTPAYTGFFLSVDDIRRIGSKFRIPHGFGNRQQILTNLLRTASDYDVFVNIMAELQTIASDWQCRLSEIYSIPAAIRQVWSARLQSAIELLRSIEQLAGQQDIIMNDDATAFAVANGQTGVGCAVEKDGINESTC